MREHHVAAQRQVGAVELQHEAGVDDGAILARHHLGERVEISLVTRIVLVFQVTRDLSGRRRRHEAFFRLGAGHRGVRAREVGLDRREVLPGDRARARRPVLERRGEVGEHRREFWELGLAGAERRRARAVEAGEAILDVGGVIGAALLAIVDHVEPAGDLPLHHLGDRAADRLLELGGFGAGALLLLQQQFHHACRPRQASGMGSENPLRAALHGVPPVPSILPRLECPIGADITSLAPLFAPDTKYVGSWAAVF